METQAINQEYHRSITGIFNCWQKMSKQIEKLDEHNKIFLSKLPTMKDIIHMHPTWNSFLKVTNYDQNNLSNDNYLLWFHSLSDFNIILENKKR